MQSTCSYYYYYYYYNYYVTVPMSAHRPGQLAGHVGASKERGLRQSIGINEDLQTLFKATQSQHTLHIIRQSMNNKNIHLMAIFQDNQCKLVPYKNVSILDFIRARMMDGMVY